MEPLSIEASAKSPQVMLDGEKGRIEIKGISDEEDALGFYFPVLQWIDNYVAHPQEKTHVELDFKYYNTASAKSIFEVLKRLSQLSKAGKEVTTLWFYPEGDDNFLSEIENFSDIAQLPIKPIEK
jgi:hypothetical protein